MAVMMVLAGCRTAARVGVDVRPDGSGTVTVSVVLDAQAAAQLGDPTTTVPLGDLRDAGWTVEAPAKDGDGLRFSGTRAFTSPAQLPEVLAEVGGKDGVFRGVRLTVDDSAVGTSYSFRSQVVLSGDPSQFSDPDLTKAVGGFALGRSADELTASGATAPGAATLVVSVRLPGDAPETNGTVRGGRAEWRFPISGGTKTAATLRTSSSETDSQVVVLFAVGAGLLVLALIVLVIGLVRTRRRA
jgi:hypothetical protein